MPGDSSGGGDRGRDRVREAADAAVGAFPEDILGRTSRGARSRARGLRGVLAGLWRFITGIPARILGSQEKHPLRFLALFLFIDLGFLFLGGILILSRRLTLAADSGPFLRVIIGFLTNWTMYAVLAVLAAVLFAGLYWDRAARVTARETRYSVRTLKRLATEAKSTDGTVRCIGTTSHSRDQLRAKLIQAWDGLASDDLPSNAAPGEAGVETRPPSERALESGIQGALEAADSDDNDVSDGDADMGDEFEDVAARLVEGRRNAEIAGVVAFLRGYTPEASPPADLTLVREHVDGLEAGLGELEGGIEGLEDEEARLEAELDALMKAQDRLEAGGDPKEIVAALDANPLVSDGVVADLQSDLGLSETVTDTADDAEAGEETRDGGASEIESGSEDGDSGGIHGSLRGVVQVMRMDLATAFSFDEFAWRFVLPAVATVFAIFTVAQTPWFNLAVYPFIGAAGVLVGGVFYMGSKVLRRRRLESLRGEPESRAWGSTNALVKRVDTPEVTLYLMWMAGKVYADYDKHRIARVGADRWHQRIHGEHVAPAIQEKFARNVQQMTPLLYEFLVNDEHEGIPAIRNDIADVVRETENPDGKVPKHLLAERVVERGEGVGHDPDLVARCYREMVPYALNETPITVTDGDGREHEMTVVSLRSDPVTADMAEIQAKFSADFSPARQGRYDLPDVDTRGMQYGDGHGTGVVA